MHATMVCTASHMRRLGRQVAGKIQHSKTVRTAQTIGLVGPLGSGKTTFAQGFATYFNIVRVPSPTFVLMRRYAIAEGGFTSLVHVDVYRLSAAEAARSLDLVSLFADTRSIVLVEWADHIQDFMPKNALMIDISPVDTACRTVRIQPI